MAVFVGSPIALRTSCTVGVHSCEIHACALCWDTMFPTWSM